VLVAGGLLALFVQLSLHHFVVPAGLLQHLFQFLEIPAPDLPEDILSLCIRMD
jgi:hypothetical protein